MACYYCIQEGMHAVDAGDCTVCNKAVCIYPNLFRADGVYHAEACHTCGMLVCEFDFHSHSVKLHSSVPSRCFPGLVAEISASGLVAASKAAEESRVGDSLSRQEQHALVRYLNVVNPGRLALSEAAGLSPIEGRYIQPPPEVFSRSFLSTLGNDMAGQAGMALAQPSINREIGVFDIGDSAIQFLTERPLTPHDLVESSLGDSQWLNTTIWRSLDPVEPNVQLNIDPLRYLLDGED